MTPERVHSIEWNEKGASGERLFSKFRKQRSHSKSELYQYEVIEELAALTVRFIERERRRDRRVQRVDRLQIDEARDTRRDTPHLPAESAAFASDHEHGATAKIEIAQSVGRIRVEGDDLRSAFGESGE